MQSRKPPFPRQVEARRRDPRRGCRLLVKHHEKENIPIFGALDPISIANVAYGVTALSQTLRHLKGHGTEAVTDVIGAVYDVQTGIVHFQNPPPDID